jgi:hypothetical protein
MYETEGLITSFDGISDYNSVRSGGGPTFVIQHNLQQFHGWKWTETSM